MTEEQIIEGNHIIFDWLLPEQKDVVKSPYFYSLACAYHTSWDWLMLAVEKIERVSSITEHSVTITRNSCHIYSHFKDFNGMGKTKIEAVWLAVVDFIKWCNIQPVQPRNQPKP